MNTKKINKRLIKIGVTCLIIAIILTSALYRNMKTAAQPEENIKIATFSQNLIRNTILEDRDIAIEDIPLSKAPATALRDKNSLVGKRLIVDVNKGEYAFNNKVTERGDIRIDIDDMWLMGLDVKDISNFIGVQLKAGEEYGLIYPDPLGQINVRDIVKIVSLVDNLGKEIISNGEGVPKTINIAVKNKDAMIQITRAKHEGAFFEMIKMPEGWSIEN